MNSEPSPSDSELQLLKLFWRVGPMSAREVQDLAGPELGWAVSTTRTTLERMRAKGSAEPPIGARIGRL
jgi:predicted transcriptional regulator